MREKMMRYSPSTSIEVANILRAQCSLSIKNNREKVKTTNATMIEGRYQNELNVKSKIL